MKFKKAAATLLVCLASITCGGGNSRENANTSKQIDNSQARAEAQEIAKSKWTLVAIDEPQWGVVVLTLVSQEGTEKTVRAEMPHAAWHRYMQLRDMEGKIITFRFLRQGYREDMENRNDGDYLSPSPASE